MTHPLDGARAKIERAGDHLEALDAGLVRFAKDGGFRLLGEEDPETGEHVLRVHSNRQPPVPPPARLSVLVGDALNNLRSALDYVVWQLAKPPSKQNQFPIFDTPKGFKKQGERYLVNVPKKHWARFEAYQPYQGLDRYPLAVLAKLNDGDKHRLLLPGLVQAAAGKGRFRVVGLDSITVKGNDWVPFENGAEVYRMKIEGHAGSGEMKVEAEVPYTVTFADAETGIAANLVDFRRILISVSNVVESFAPAFD